MPVRNPTYPCVQPAVSPREEPSGLSDRAPRRLDTPVGVLHGIGPMSWSKAHTLWIELDRTRPQHRCWTLILSAEAFDRLAREVWGTGDARADAKAQARRARSASLGDVLTQVQRVCGERLDRIEERLASRISEEFTAPPEAVAQPLSGDGEARVVLFDGPLHLLPIAVDHGTGMPWNPWQIGVLWAGWYEAAGARPVSLVDGCVELRAARRPAGWGEAIELAAQQQLYAANEQTVPEAALRRVMTQRSWTFAWN